MEALRSVNSTAYGYISAWALLTACEQRLFDRLPASADELTDRYPDTDLTETWLRVLERHALVEERDGRWSTAESIAPLLVGDGRFPLPVITFHLVGVLVRNPPSLPGLFEGWKVHSVALSERLSLLTGFL